MPKNATSTTSGAVPAGEQPAPQLAGSDDLGRVPDSFRTSPYGDLFTKYECELCPFDTLYLGVAQTHAKFGHFVGKGPGDAPPPALPGMPHVTEPAATGPQPAQRSVRAVEGADTQDAGPADA